MSGMRALIVIDLQQGFTDPKWGPTTNPAAEANVGRLVAAWQERELGPVVLVRHDSRTPGSPLHPAQPGNAFMPTLDGVQPALLVHKHVNSAFYGEPSLDAWLTERGIRDIVLCGIQTNMCVETTARMGGNLGYSVTVPLDATRTFDITTTLGDGTVVSMTAEELMRATATSLHGGGFATVTSTDALLAGL